MKTKVMALMVTAVMAGATAPTTAPQDMCLIDMTENSSTFEAEDGKIYVVENYIAPHNSKYMCFVSDGKIDRIITDTNIEDCKENSNVYALTAIVAGLDKENNIVTAEDYNGNSWKFEGVEDWEINDCVSMVMNDSGTKDIFDDEIVSIRYAAWKIEK